MMKMNGEINLKKKIELLKGIALITLYESEILFYLEIQDLF